LSTVVCLVLSPSQRSFRSFGNDDRHVMAKHSTIYPSSHELEAVQSLVSTVERALKQVSDWLDQSNNSSSSNGNGTGCCGGSTAESQPGASGDREPGDDLLADELGGGAVAAEEQQEEEEQQQEQQEEEEEEEVEEEEATDGDRYHTHLRGDAAIT